MCTGQPSAPLDPDLQGAYERATRRTSTKGQAVPLTAGQQIQAREIQAEQQRRDELHAANERLAEQRRAEVARVAETQKQAEAQRQAELQRQATVQQQAEQARIAQEQQIGQERVATQAMSQSMRVLGTSAKSGTAPTAQMSKGGRSRSQVRPTAGSTTLRIGSSVAASGAGLNIGV